MGKKGFLFLACGVVAIGATVLGYIYRDSISEKATELKGQIASKMKRNAETATNADPAPASADVVA